MPLDRTTEIIDLADDTQLWVGRLISVDGTLSVSLNAVERRPVQRAASCLLELAEGDTVLVHGRGAMIYVIAVLSRLPETKSVLRPAQGDVLALQARDIEIQAEKNMAIGASKAQIHFAEASVHTRSAHFFGEAMTLVGGMLRTLARSIENTADRMPASFGSRATQITDADVLKANTSMTSVTGLAATRTGSIAITAKHDVRVDAERISLG